MRLWNGAKLGGVIRNIAADTATIFFRRQPIDYEVYMNDFETLVTKIKERFPSAKIKTDQPEDPQGTYWLDVENCGKSLTLDWSLKKGFGFYVGNYGYGQRPTVLIAGVENAVEVTLQRITEALQE